MENKLELTDLKKLENYSSKQIKVLMGSKNDLDSWAYPCVTPRELKVIDRVLSKIKVSLEQEKELLKLEEETNDSISQN